MSEYHNTIWTIGHSTRSQEEFLEVLKSFEIEIVADVRRYPGSKKFPQFNASELQSYLPSSGIRYEPMPELGGRRKPVADTANKSLWRNESFRGYAEYSGTDPYADGIDRLTQLAMMERTAYMCSELLWWRCHRAIISDSLKSNGWIVMHILKKGIATEHPYTSVYLESHPGLNSR